MLPPCKVVCAMNKAELRKKILEKRRMVSNPATAALVCEKASRLDAFQRAENIFLYLATGSELCTTRLLSIARRMGKKILLPRVLDGEIMEAALLDGQGLREGAFHIWEPVGPSVTNIDIAFVPGTVFDKNRNRIGYGKGYYDRFLQKHSGIYKVGLAYDCQVVENITADPTDIPMDILLTEMGRYE